MRLMIAAAALSVSSMPSFADVRVDFIEGAPKDRFVITNATTCALSAGALVIDLEGSAGALIFDTTAIGAGVEVFQPFELVSGAEYLGALPVVSDGDKVITLELSGLTAGAEVSFTIDVDDTLSARQITVTDAEIAGAQVRLGDQTAAFGATAQAALDVASCAA